MKSAKWILIASAAFIFLSAQNINYGSAASVPSSITKEEDFDMVGFEKKLYSQEPTLPQSNCPDGMVEVTGDYCNFVKETCLKWIDSDKEYPMMCGEFAYPTKCLSKPIAMSFCIDKYEAQDKFGEIPEVFIDWYTAQDKCKSSGKRLCDVRELTLACEGPERKPYPYGYKRDIKKCNMGHQWIDPDNTPFDKIDRRAPSGSYEDCKSDYGVYDAVGNTDEWSINSEGSMTKEPFKSALFGGHYVNGIRNRCRDRWVPSITVSHGPTAKNYEISYRCCADIK